MKKALFLLLILILQSCNNTTSVVHDDTSDKLNSVSVIIDDLLWNGEVGDLLRENLASPVVGLPQEEPQFTINQYPVKLLEGYEAHCRNIIVIKKGEPNRFEIKENEYRKNQIAIYVYGRTSRDVINLLEKNSQLIMNKLKAGEIAENQRLIENSLLDNKKIIDKFKIILKVPSGYKYVMEKPNFIWLKKEITSGNTSVLIYEVPLGTIQSGVNTVSSIIKMRDSIGNLYIHGAVPETRMITERSYAPYLFQSKICRRNVIETKGTWQLDNDFMSGPFINYAIRDTIGNRIVVLEGFCYAPSKEKRDLMLELEAIMRSIKFVKR